MATKTLPSADQHSVETAAALRRDQRNQVVGLLSPGLIWLLLFFVAPLLIIVVYSFLVRGQFGGVSWLPTIGNYVDLFTSPVYLNAYWRSILVSVLTTVLTILLAYPMALFIAQRSPRWKLVLLFLVLLPFWTNFLVRTYAWMIILNDNGVLNTILRSIGLPGQSILYTETATLLGLVYGELPFMVLPIYTSLDRFDFRLMEGAADLGANRWQAFRRVMLPMTMPGVIAGSVLVFIPTVGQFVVSELLGGAKVDYIGNLLQRLFLRSNPPNWPLGSAMAVVMMLILTLVIVLYFRGTTEDDR
ncbi:MAG: ABC transporter permease [Roseiflexaceae bacterium]|nr:ABC transporter permease [Roseiflexaceae bacterium]